MKDKIKKYLDLLAMFSHEIRTPLNGVLGFSEILRTEATECSEEHKIMIGHINEASLRVLDAFNDLMDTAKYVFRPFDLLLESVDLADLFLSVERILNKQYWMAYGRSFRFIIEPDVNLQTIEADKSMLHNMFLWFICDNSRHFRENREDNVFFIHLTSKSGFAEISISNISDEDNSKTRKFKTESYWSELILEIAKAHSGQFEFKTDGNDKPYAAITLPITQKKN